MSKLSHKVRHDLRLSVPDRMELADALDAMEAALREARVSCDQAYILKIDAALAKLEGK